MLDIESDGIVFKEGNTVEEARKNLKIAARLFLEESEKRGIKYDLKSCR